MINLILLNSELFIFDVEGEYLAILTTNCKTRENIPDWLTLRKEHRIIGDFVGSLNSIPGNESLKPFVI